MPVYEYKCRKCGAEFEKFFRSLAAAKNVKCEKCGSSQVTKLITCCSVSSRGKGGGSDSSSSCGSCSGDTCSTCH
ncbi:MAG: zinc ribbon domain-containing protein [Candidatus Aminicenantes bacterium]|nr:zinc ribbon domain-containing protein [Candidatus Aminicenantes bacterium]